MNETTFLGKPIIFGTRFLGDYTEISGKSFTDAMNDIDRNPFKYIPLFITTAINTTAEINKTEGIDINEVYNEIDRIGINSDEVQNLLQVFVKSIEVRVNPAKGKKKAGK